MACTPPGDHVAEGCRQQPASGLMPKEARHRCTSFGTDDELALEMPANWTLSRFQDSVKRCLAEYFVSLALDDIVSQITELVADCPSEADELCVVAIRSALDRDETGRLAVVNLLNGLCRANVIDQRALLRSFEKLFCTWEDIAIDAPQTPEGLLDILHGCLKGRSVPEALLTKLPESLLNVSVNKVFAPELRSALKEVSEKLKDFKRQAQRCIDEFFVSWNDEEVVTFLKELDLAAYHHEFVKKAITSSFSQGNTDSAREAVISLLTKLTTSGLLATDDLHWGITRLLGQLDDLELDCPRCLELATEFCIAALADGLVSAPFLRRCRCLRIGGATGLQVLDVVQRRKPEYAKKQLCETRFKQEVQAMILEYFNSGDEVEFGRCIRELQPLTKEQSSEIVRKVMVFAIERSGAECEKALKLLVWLCRHEELDPHSLELGFDDLYLRMPDVKLDVPDAEEMARTFIVEAQKAKILRASWPEPEEQ